MKIGLLTGCLFIFIEHGKRTMSEFGTSVGLSVDCTNLIEFRSGIFGDKISSSFTEQENIVLFLQELGNLLILSQV